MKNFQFLLLAFLLLTSCKDKNEELVTDAFFQGLSVETTNVTAGTNSINARAQVRLGGSVGSALAFVLVSTTNNPVVGSGTQSNSTVVTQDGDYPFSVGGLNSNRDYFVRAAIQYTANGQTIYVYGATVSVRTSGSASTGNLTVSVSQLNFGAQAVGSSTYFPLTVSNTGAAALNNIIISSPPTFFSVTPNSTFNLAPGASQNFQVYYSPTAAGSHGGAITFANAAVAQNVNMSGTATSQSTANLTHNGGWDFGAVQLNSTQTYNLRITNTGNASAVLSGSGLTFPFSGYSDVTIPAQSFRDFSIVFSPTVVGNYISTLTINYNGGTLSIPFSGNVIQSAIIQLAADQSFTIPNIDFGQAQSFQTTKSRTLYIRNTGNQPLVITGITSNNTGIFRNPTPTGGYPLTIQPGAWYGLGVTANRPTPTGTTVNGTYTVYSNASNGNAIIGLTIQSI